MGNDPDWLLTIRDITKAADLLRGSGIIYFASDQDAARIRLAQAQAEIEKAKAVQAGQQPAPSPWPFAVAAIGVAGVIGLVLLRKGD
jgi:hypothetical protein